MDVNGTAALSTGPVGFGVSDVLSVLLVTGATSYTFFLFKCVSCAMLWAPLRASVYSCGRGGYYHGPHRPVVRVTLVLTGQALGTVCGAYEVLRGGLAAAIVIVTVSIRVTVVLELRGVQCVPSCFAQRLFESYFLPR